MKAFVYANEEKMQIFVEAEEATEEPGRFIGDLEAPQFSLTLVRIYVAPMLVKAHLPPTGWSITIHNHLVNPS